MESKNQSNNIKCKKFEIFNHKIKETIRIAIYTGTLYGGGRAKITAILINYLIKIKIFDIYLFTFSEKHENEYKIPNNTKRILIKNILLY